MLVIDRTRKVAVKRMFDLRGAGIRVVAQVSPTAGPWVEKAIIDDARTQGYIALEADCDLPEAARRRFWHRHVLLLQRGPLSSMGARWIRELSQASPRAHAVLVVPLDNDTAVCVAEAGPSAQAELRPLPPAPVRGGGTACLERQIVTPRGQRAGIARDVGTYVATESAVVVGGRVRATGRGLPPR